jgi:hypothetical protein
MTTPNLALQNWEENIEQPDVPFNANVTIIDALLQGAVEAIEEDAPTTVTGDIGKSWIVGSGTWPTGLTVPVEHDLAYCTAPDVFLYLTPKEGWNFRDKSAAGRIEFNGTTWVSAGTSGGGNAPVVTEATTNLDADDTNSGNYTRFTNAGTKTYVFDDAESFTAGDEYHGRNAGAGDLTITAGGTMTINAPAGGTLVVPQNGTFTVKIVATDQADLFGITVPL